MNYIIGNWKSNKTLEETAVWLSEFLVHYKSQTEMKVIICPTFLHLPFMARKLKKTGVPLILGAQNLSEFDNGPYTGEVSAQMLKEYVKYSLIGHSERRKYQKETNKQIANKINLALKYEIEPILCVQSANTPIPDSVKIIAFEPINAIGTGNPVKPESANKILREIKKMYPNIRIGIYGGSVNAENAASFLKQSFIDGVLPGTASLDAAEFTRLINNASKIQT